jgi:hypothetical protein
MNRVAEVEDLQLCTEGSTVHLARLLQLLKGERMMYERTLSILLWRDIQIFNRTKQT